MEEDIDLLLSPNGNLIPDILLPGKTVQVEEVRTALVNNEVMLTALFKSTQHRMGRKMCTLASSG